MQNKVTTLQNGTLSQRTFSKPNTRNKITDWHEYCYLTHSLPQSLLRLYLSLQRTVAFNSTAGRQIRIPTRLLLSAPLTYKLKNKPKKIQSRINYYNLKKKNLLPMHTKIIPNVLKTEHFNNTKFPAIYLNTGKHNLTDHVEHLSNKKYTDFLLTNLRQQQLK